MDIEIFIYAIMIDAKGSKSNIAAKFQNALTLHVLPPIGVFWDIENCHVPKGKSALALVQNIREKFFAHHREAEFMCVCDINKESKIVIQELILAQVTVVHISATSKNAADDKLKQCMRRFVDTHGSPSTLLLISDDVNFSSDLSDFRHRHNIRIILIHRGRAHPSLIACAHEHYEYCTITNDLPSRSPVKSSERRPNMLKVSDLPTNRNVSQVKALLKKLCQNCGGKVSEIRGSRAYIKFSTAEATERAQKRMDKENVFGSEINVSFCQAAEWDFNGSPFRKGNKDSSNEVSGASSSSRDSSTSPPRDVDVTKTNSNISQRFDFPPPPVLDGQSIPSWLKNTSSAKEFQLQKSTKTSNLFPAAPSVEIKDNRMFQLDWNRNKIQSHSNLKSPDISAFSPFKKETDLRVKYPQKNVGMVSPFVMQDCDKNGRTSHSDPSNTRHINIQLDSPSNSYLFPTQSYQNSAQSLSSPFEIQRISDPSIYSSTWNGTSAVSDSALSVSRNNPVPSLDNSSCVELHVSNLDPTFEVNEMKKILLSVFREHVMVLHISMCLQPDGSAKATVKVPSLQDAQYAISRLHHKKIGHKRILISHVSSDKIPPFHILKSETVALLNDIPNKSLPLIKFRELYENRFHRPIAVSELYKMRETVTIQGDSGSRIVYLNAEYCNTPSLPESEDSQEFRIIERPYCEVHFQVSASEGWAEQYNICPLPLVHISLKVLATAVHTLLDSHQGSLPLISFCDCYEAEIGPMPIVGSFENISCKEDSLEVSSGANPSSVVKIHKGVPLEHLIACIAGVEVAKSILCIKKVQWLGNKTDSQAPQNFSPALMGQLTLFGREVMDLLKSQSRCLVQFNKFIPTYHHHFGRQCRVADYGFTKLIDLLEAIPHIVQVLGEGQNRQVTLTHRTQVKRFAAELLRILKSRASKQIAVSEFPLAYEQVIEKAFEITNYGVCEIEDMIAEVPENVIVVKGTGEDKVLKLVESEQHKILIERLMVVLMSQPDEKIEVAQLCSAYAQIHGHILRPSDFGFSDLKELLEKFSFDFKIVSCSRKNYVCLVNHDLIHQISLNLRRLLMEQKDGMMSIKDTCNSYHMRFGKDVKLVSYLKDLTDVIQITGGFLQLTPLQLLARDMIILLQENGSQIPLSTFSSFFQQKYGFPISVNNYGFQSMFSMMEHLSDYFIVKGKKQKRVVCLNPETTSCFLPSIILNKVFKPALPLQVKPNLDILNQPVPSCIPSPNLRPQVKTGLDDLMGFETPPVHDVFSKSDMPNGLKSSKENATLLKASECCSVAVSLNTELPIVCQKCPVSTVSYSVPCFEFPSDCSKHFPEMSLGIHEEKSVDFHQETETSICSVIEISKNSVFPFVSESSPEICEAQSIIEKFNGFNDVEHLKCLGITENSAISLSSEDMSKCNNSPLETKDDLPSSKSTPTSDSRQQSRRKRIAAQFSSPIDN